MKYLLFTAAWSKAGQQLESNFINFLFHLDVEVIYLEVNPKMHENFAIRKHPTLIKMLDGKEIARTNEIDLVELLDFTQENLNVENTTGNVRSLGEAVSGSAREAEIGSPGVVRDYVLKRTIIIPAGTVFTGPPVESSRWRKDYEAPIALDNDHTGWFSFDIESAKEAGLI